MTTLTDIERRVRRLAAQIAAPEHPLPTFGRSEDERPNVETDGHGFSYVLMSRGSEVIRRAAFDDDDLLWHVFDAVTFSMAVDYEVHHRIRGKDSRRLIFERQCELIGKLSPDWRKRTQDGHHRTFIRFPVDDER